MGNCNPQEPTSIPPPGVTLEDPPPWIADERYQDTTSRYWVWGCENDVVTWYDYGFDF